MVIYILFFTFVPLYYNTNLSLLINRHARTVAAAGADPKQPRDDGARRQLITAGGGAATLLFFLFLDVHTISSSFPSPESCPPRAR